MRRELKDIVGRRKEFGQTIRELACGHTQVEPNGGKAHLATKARCRACLNPEPPREESHAN